MIYILIIILVFAVFGAIAFFTVKKIKETDVNNVDGNTKKQPTTTQDYLPFEDIKDSMINLGQHQYRAIIKCSSINYHLKTDKEKMIIEASYQRFLNSLTHPISIFIQTKMIDNSKMLKNLKRDIESSVDEFPLLSVYSEDFYEKMTDVYNYTGNNKEKNKYIIVPYNDAITLTNLTDNEKYEYALKEIENRCQIIIEGLQSIGINSNILPTSQVIELLYTSNHKDNSSQAENITSGEFLTMIVKGEDKLAKVTDEGRLDWILYEAQLRLETELLKNNVIDENLKNRSMDAVTELGKMRDALAGEYQYTFNINEKLDLFK